MRKKIFLFNVKKQPFVRSMHFFKLNILILSIIFVQNIGMPSYAIDQTQYFQNRQENPAKENIVYTHCITKDQTESANELNIFLAQYLNDINSYNIQKLGDYYASNFMSGDGFNKDQTLNLTKQTWEKYPDLKYSSSIKNLRLDDNNRASVEFVENITATTKDKSEITKDKGSINGESQNILYLEKYGCGWKIVTDKILYEKTEIKYGTAKNINVKFDVPEQVFSGENYLTSVKVDVPSEIFALGSIASAPIVYPLKQPEETFRQIPPDLNTLERVIKVNNKSLNEITSASVTLCEAQRNSYTGIDLKVTGLAVILKRINVVQK